MVFDFGIWSNLLRWKILIFRILRVNRWVVNLLEAESVPSSATVYDLLVLLFAGVCHLSAVECCMYGTCDQSYLTKSHIAFLLPLSVGNTFACCMHWTGTFATVAGKQCGMQSCVNILQWAGTCFLKSVPGELDPHLKQSSLGPHDTTTITHPNSISVISAIFAQLMHVISTDRHTDHAMCDIFSSRPCQCTVCSWCSLIMSVDLML